MSRPTYLPGPRVCRRPPAPGLAISACHAVPHAPRGAGEGSGILRFDTTRYYLSACMVQVAAGFDGFKEGGCIVLALWRPLDGPPEAWTLDIQMRTDACRSCQSHLVGSEAEVEARFGELVASLGAAYQTTPSVYTMHTFGRHTLAKLQNEPPNWASFVPA